MHLSILPFFFALLSTITLMLVATSVQAVCPDGYVGVGITQKCDIFNSCEGPFAAIYANDCGFISTSSKPGICDGSWPSGYGVNCTGSQPSCVETTGGNFGNCYSVHMSCNGTMGMGHGMDGSYNSVNYCCSRL